MLTTQNILANQYSCLPKKRQEHLLARILDEKHLVLPATELLQLHNIFAF